MAELLIFTRNNTHTDPVAERAGCYKRGHIVTVQPDGVVWGASEGLPTFVIVKIPGVSVATVNALIAPQTVDDTGVPVVDADNAPVVFRRREWRIPVDSIPTAIKNILLTTGSITVTPTQIRNYIQRVRDNVVFSGI